MSVWGALKVCVANLFGSYELFKIDEGYYQSGKIGLGGLKKLEREGINVIVDLQGGFDLELFVGKFDVYYLWPIKDKAELPPLLELHNLALSVKTLVDSGNDKKVLVHCSAGFNRSGLFNGVMLSYRGYHGQAILDKVREGRPGALYNQTFADYLLRL